MNNQYYNHFHNNKKNFFLDELSINKLISLYYY